MKKRKGFTLTEVLINLLLFGIARSQMNYSATLARGETARDYYNLDACIYQITLDMKCAEEIVVVSSSQLYISTKNETIVYELGAGTFYRNGVEILNVADGEFSSLGNRAFELRVTMQSYPEIKLYFACTKEAAI